MTEQIIAGITEGAGLASTLRCAADGGFSVYATGGRVIARFLDGGELRAAEITVSGKSRNASALFEALESFCRAVPQMEMLKGEDYETTLVEVSRPPVFESFGEKGFYTASAVISVEYLYSGGEGTYIFYENENGASADFSKGLVRAYTVGGVLPSSKQYFTENALADGGTHISDRTESRRIVLVLRLCCNAEKAAEILGRTFSASSVGTLYFRSKGRSRRISCRTESVSSVIGKNPETAEVTLLCNDPFFTGNEDSIICICGHTALLEFDGWELPENAEFEFSQVKESSSAYIFNPGEIPTGCVVRISAERDIPGVRITNTTTGEFISVKKSVPKGKVIIIDTRSSSRGIFLTDPTGDVTEDITANMEWGSSFFSIIPGSNRIFVGDTEGLNGVTVSVFFSERYEGI